MTASVPFLPSLTVAPQDFRLGLHVTSGLQPSGTAISFGSSGIGSSITPQPLTLTNTGQTPISLSGISINGLNSADFVQTNNCPAVLPATAICNIQATFAPSGTGPRVAVLSFANSSANSPLLIELAGIGTVQTVAPQVIAASPGSVLVGSSNTVVTITGTGFTPSTTVYLGGYAQPTTFISSQSVSFTVGAQYSYSTGTPSLYVRNPGFVSNFVSLPIVNPAPTLTSISPATVIAGASNFPLTLTGSGFSASSTVVINGVSYSLNVNSGTTATVTVSATTVASLGNLPVTIVNPSPGGGTSTAQQLQVIGAPNRVRTLAISTVDLAVDSAHNLIYASVSSASATSPNSIVAINPLLGTVVATLAMSSQPDKLAIASDDSYLYVSLPSTGQISRFILPSLTPDITWSLGTDVSGICSTG